ncbi:NACHT, LRR and PYD domains-containing protein 3-like [Aquarana catesbeiana]|uniref:NACHT, LRR and PYD domains-containing protein 3-like n=1 Tax=Aquarana catesbeiana TaxID=8400 RepID=UPI003CCA3ED1
MANSSSSSSQGLAPGVDGKRKQTHGDLILYSLEDLKGRDFKKFKNKLSDFSYEDKLPLPRGRLENADWITTKDLLISTYGEEGALKVTIKVFTLIGLMGPANDLQKRKAQNAKLKKLTHDSRLTEFGNEYRESVKEMLLRFKEYNSLTGESVNLQKRYIKLLMRKGTQNKEEKEQEIRSSDRRHLQIMDKRHSDESSPTTIQALFDPDEDGFIPKIVVLEGPAGIGKTMTSKKIMLDWASGDLYQDKFDFVFFLNCREINTITRNISLVELLCRACREQCSDDLVSILKDPRNHRRLLFIVDGFDELRWTLEEEPEVCLDAFEETHKEILLQRLLKKQILRQSSLIITTRSLALEKLNTFIDVSRYVEIHGFTREGREEYVHKFFGNKEDADKVLSIINSDILYTMCAVPITCWIVCTIIKQEIKKDLGLIQFKTVTSIYLLYLEVLIKHHRKKNRAMDRNPKASHTCLKKLCALANEGVLNQQILFEEGDLERHGLSLSEVESVFLNENNFHWDARTQTCYSFIHLSVQEFLAALHYGLDDGSGNEEGTSEEIKDPSLLEIYTGESLSDLLFEHPHVALAVQFLFGLLNEKELKAFTKSTGINISFQATYKIQKRALKSIDGRFSIFYIFCLYETQNEDFIRRILSSCSDLTMYSYNTDVMNMDSNYSKQLVYCLKTLKSESFQRSEFHYLSVDPECQKNLSPLLHRCQEVKFIRCKFHSKCGESYLGELKAEDEEGSSSSEDKMDPANLSFLINPESKIKDLGLHGCGVTPSCWEVFHSVLFTNKSLTRLELSYNNLQDSGVKHLCEGLRHPGCSLQDLSLWSCDLTHLCCDDLRSVLITNQSLTKLDLSYNKLKDSGIKLVCDGLRDPGCTLQELSLCECDLSHLCCDYFHSILITNRSLIKLDLSNNSLQDFGIKLLLAGIRDPGCTLQELSLQSCNLSPLCCDDLSSVLITNGSLTKLNLSGNKLQDSGIKLLCEGLRHPGCTLQELRVSDCKVTFSCCDDLCSVITTNRTLNILETTLDDDEKILDSEVDRCCDALQHVGFTVKREQKQLLWRDARWKVNIYRSILENGQYEVISLSSADDNWL